MKTKYFKILTILCMSALFITSCNNENEDSLPMGATGSAESRNTVFAIKGGSEATSGTRAASLNGTTWNAGQTIKIKFLDGGGSAYARKKVEEYAKEWTKYANLNFEFVPESTDADVKIAFNYLNSRVAWSLIGKKCSSVSNSSKKPSMNIPFYNDNDVNSEEFKAVVLREFGHVLGLLFEHQGPNGNGLFDWNESRLLTYFKQQGWTDDEIYDLIDITYTTRQTKFTDFDEKSIMLLFFPAFLTTNNKETSWNTTLSELDIRFVSELYSGRSLDEIPDRMPITHMVNSTAQKYEAVRIGEYIWMNSNLKSPVMTPSVNQHQINRSLWVLGIDTLQYTITPAQYHEYIGQFYANATRQNDLKTGKIIETRSYGQVEKSWGVPSKKDFRQLFAMCGNGGNNDVLTTLSYKEGEIPIAQKVLHNHWMHNINTNKYGFNLVYAGYRQHDGTDIFLNKENGRSINLKQGDVAQVLNYHLLSASDGFIQLEDYPNTEKLTTSYLWLPIRWCRKLTDAELGYKLYVNSTQTDIKKLSLTDAAPAGYVELGNGYLRGFYVQYILNNANPQKTVADIKQMALSLPDVTHHGAPIVN